MGLPRCVLGLLSAPSVLPARACVARRGYNSDLLGAVLPAGPRTLARRRRAGAMGAGGGFGVVRDAQGSENLKTSGHIELALSSVLAKLKALNVDAIHCEGLKISAKVARSPAKTFRDA